MLGREGEGEEGVGEEPNNGVLGREGKWEEGVGEKTERSRFKADFGVAFPVVVERDLGVLKLPKVLS